MDAERTTRTALVVDDEPDIAAMARAVLEIAGYQVTCILNSQLALQRLATERYDVIVTDMVMPEVDGAQLIREARRLGSQARIVAVSGGGALITPDDALRIAAPIGANAVLQKPFTPAQLLAACTGPKVR